jgi:anti-sigma B factor antagonist
LTCGWLLAEAEPDSQRFNTFAVSFGLDLHAMADQLSIDDELSTPEVRVLKLNGALVLTTIFQLQQMVRENTSSSLIIDMSGVSYCDSAGIGALVNAHVSHIRTQRELALRGVNKRVMDVLKIVRVDQLFTILPATSVASAG